MSKTIKQWLETLPEPYRTEALENMQQGVSFLKVSTLEVAVKTGFTWYNTTQGYDYWNRIHLDLKNGTFEIKQLQDRITLIEAKHGVTLNATPETQAEYQQLKKELETKINGL